MTRGASKRGQGTTPAWAIAVATKVKRMRGLDWWEIDVRWRTDRTGKVKSSGVTNWTMGTGPTSPCYITVTAGTDIIDQAVTLVHELAHVVAGHAAAHNAGFWKICFELFVDLDLPFYYCYYSSAQYRDTAAWVAETLYQIPEEYKHKCREYCNGSRHLGVLITKSWHPTKFNWKMVLDIDDDEE